MMQIPFRSDVFGRNFYMEDEAGHLTVLPYQQGKYASNRIFLDVQEEQNEDVLKIHFSIHTARPMKLKRLGFRLGIDTYMVSYPEWNEQYFPTVLRCEKQGFWSCFVSPRGKMIGVFSPDSIVSWKNEYNDSGYDVGHRIWTSSVEMINTYPQPERHPQSPTELSPEPIEVTLYYTCPRSVEEVYEMAEKYAGIHIPQANKYTLEPGENLVVDGKAYPKALAEGYHRIESDHEAELSVYVRKDWFYYLDCARRKAEVCQQKVGSNCESWYGYFSRVLYAAVIKDADYTADLCREFDIFFDKLTVKENGIYRMKPDTGLYRLQNITAMLSLLADFYELTGNLKYLENANQLCDYLLTLQDDDGNFRNGGILYTCVLYPAKSLMELAEAERQAGMDDRAKKHDASAYKAIKSLEQLLDNIQTEGEMTFEDGMISCEMLQLAYLALYTKNQKERLGLTDAAKYIQREHWCLEQQFLPDCRVRGCTLRFWEARYDLNFFANMLNAPHAWTSWKTYGTYYLYLLTGEEKYLTDTMDTMGACMQCVDADGDLNWGYVPDPCIPAERLKKGSSEGNIQTERVVIGECYLPMISDWWRQDENKVVAQYLMPYDDPSQWHNYYGGSCDNDVHEHFKCMMETVFGKAFIHEQENGFLTYNCRQNQNGFTSNDEHLRQWVAYLHKPAVITLNGQPHNLPEGFSFVPVSEKDS